MHFELKYLHLICFCCQIYSGLTPKNFVLTDKALISKPTSTSTRCAYMRSTSPRCPHASIQPMHSLIPSLITTSNWTRNICTKCCGCWKKEHIKIRHHMLYLAEPYKVKVWHSDGLYTGWGSYSETLLSRGEATFESHEESRGILSVPAIVLYHVGQLDNELPLFVLLTQFKCPFLQK